MAERRVDRHGVPPADGASNRQMERPTGRWSARREMKRPAGRQVAGHTAVIPQGVWL